MEKAALQFANKKHGASFTTSQRNGKSDGIIIPCDLEAERKNVESIERLFVEGRFRRALECANDYLIASTVQDKEGRNFEGDIGDNDNGGDVSRYSSSCYVEDDTIWLLRSKFRFHNFDDGRVNRVVAIQRIPSGTEGFASRLHTNERVGSVALQSWYEIFRRVSGNASMKKKGNIHLHPFLDHYFPKKVGRKRAISMQLMVIFVQFCHATGNFSVSVELSAGIFARWCSPKSESNVLSRSEMESWGEIALHLFSSLLPKAENLGAILTKLQNQIQNKASVDNETFSDAPLQATVSTTTADPKSLVRIISFIDACQTICPKWQKRFLRDARADLVDMVENLDENDCRWEEEEETAGTNPSHQVTTNSAPDGPEQRIDVDRRNKTSSGPTSQYYAFVRRIAETVRRRFFEDNVVALQKDEETSSLWRRRHRSTKLALLVLTACIAWRQRRRIGGGFTKLALVSFRILARPIQEILEAVVPTSSGR